MQSHFLSRLDYVIYISFKAIGIGCVRCGWKTTNQVGLVVYLNGAKKDASIADCFPRNLESKGSTHTHPKWRQTCEKVCPSRELVRKVGAIYLSCDKVLCVHIYLFIFFFFYQYIWSVARSLINTMNDGQSASVGCCWANFF